MTKSLSYFEKAAVYNISRIEQENCPIKAGSGNDQSKGGAYVVDNCSNTDHSLGTGAGEQLHDGRFYSHPAGRCHYYCAGQSHTGAETHLKRSINGICAVKCIAYSGLIQCAKGE